MRRSRLQQNDRRGRSGRRRQPSRRGAILIAALVALVLAGMIGASVARHSLALRRVGRLEAWRVQADWLAESALERAAARLAADPDYKGETWNIPAETFGAGDDAAVKIEVSPVAGQPDRRAVSVRADYPNDSHNRARRVKQAVARISSRETEQ